jgi:hypothetical protein
MPDEKPTSVPPDECAHKRILMAEIKAVISEILKVHTDEFDAVVDGNYDTGPATAERLMVAREHKALLIERYRDHVLEHGC